jgi:hypothetical protein
MNKNQKNIVGLAVVEITPAYFRCVSCACPSVFETDRGTFILVGGKINREDAPETIKSKIGAGETAIEIPKGLITELFSKE